MTRRPTAFPALLSAALAMVLLPGSVRAQPGEGEGAPQASEAERAIARKKFIKAKELHAAHKYREAAAAYLEAYEHFPAPAFLYNVAQVYRLAGDRKRALEHYKRYLELEPDGEGSGDARDFVASLEGEEQGREPAPVAEQPEGPDTSTFEPLDPERRPADRGTGGSPGRGKKIAGTVIGAAGVVALGVAVGFGVSAHSAQSDLDGYTGPWTDEQQQTYEDGQSAQRTMAISAAVGGASLAVGAILFYMGHRDAKQAERASVSLDAGGGGDGAFVLLRGSF